MKGRAGNKVIYKVILVILVALLIYFIFLGNNGGLYSNTVPALAVVSKSNGSIVWYGWSGDMIPYVSNTYLVSCPLIAFNETFFTYSCNGVKESIENPLPYGSVPVIPYSWIYALATFIAIVIVALYIRHR
jgi:hypothetical protein